MIDAVQPKQTSVITPTTGSTLPPAASTTTPPKSPGKFGRIFGGILGGAVNIMAPGAGALVGSLIRGGVGTDMVGVETMLAHSAQQQMQMIALQNRVQTSSQEFATVSNLLKARHDGEMDAIRNFKS